MPRQKNIIDEPFRSTTLLLSASTVRVLGWMSKGDCSARVARLAYVPALADAGSTDATAVHPPEIQLAQRIGTWTKYRAHGGPVGVLGAPDRETQLRVTG